MLQRKTENDEFKWSASKMKWEKLKQNDYRCVGNNSVKIYRLANCYCGN